MDDNQKETMASIQVSIAEAARGFELLLDEKDPQSIASGLEELHAALKAIADRVGGLLWPPQSGSPGEAAV